MTEHNEHFERWLTTQVQAQRYPKTPDLVRAVPGEQPARPTNRGLRWAVALAAALAIASLSVPSVRARVAAWLQIGGVTILIADDTPAPALTELPEPVDPATQLALSGKTTLAAARLDFQHPIAYPSSMGEPQHVYLQDFGTGPFVILIWVDPHEPEDVILVQYILAPHTHLTKGEVPVLEHTFVHGTPAIWTNGPYSVNVQGFHQGVVLVDEHALIWERDGLTYRLETDRSITDAVALAESIP